MVQIGAQLYFNQLCSERFGYKFPVWACIYLEMPERVTIINVLPVLSWKHLKIIYLHILNMRSEISAIPGTDSDPLVYTE